MLVRQATRTPSISSNPVVVVLEIDMSKTMKRGRRPPFRLDDSLWKTLRAS
jgi:hypothetical protein